VRVKKIRIYRRKSTKSELSELVTAQKSRSTVEQIPDLMHNGHRPG